MKIFIYGLKNDYLVYYYRLYPKEVEYGNGILSLQ